MPARVFVVDDDDDVRRALDRLLTSFGFDVQSFPTAHAFLGAPRDRGPGCVLVDFRLPDLDGLGLQRAIVAQGEPLGVVFLTAHGDVLTSVQAMKAGASDFLIKPVDAAALKAAVDRALALSARDHQHQVELAGFRGRLARLTPREREVFALVVEGLLNKQIGDRLGTSEKTVKVHRARVMRKLGVGSVAELARLVERTAVLGESAREPR